MQGSQRFLDLRPVESGSIFQVPSHMSAFPVTSTFSSSIFFATSGGHKVSGSIFQVPSHSSTVCAPGVGPPHTHTHTHAQPHQSEKPTRCYCHSGSWKVKLLLHKTPISRMRTDSMKLSWPRRSCCGSGAHVPISFSPWANPQYLPLWQRPLSSQNFLTGLYQRTSSTYL